MSRPQAPKPGSPAQNEPSGSRPFAGLRSILPHLPAKSEEEPSAPRAQIDSPSPLARALAGKIVISRESKGRAGKTVTFARGIDASQGLLEALAKELRHELGSGVRVEARALVVQGAQGERLAACLARRGAARIVIGN